MRSYVINTGEGRLGLGIMIIALHVRALAQLHTQSPLVKGLSRMEGLWERSGNGKGVGTGTPFRDKPPRLSRKGALRAGSSINAPLRDNRGGGGGACLERVC